MPPYKPPGSFRQCLHGSGLKSTRFHDLETASKTTRFRSVYTEPILSFPLPLPFSLRRIQLKVRAISAKINYLITAHIMETF